MSIVGLFVGVGHHRPLTDEDDPCSTTWFYSLNKDTGTLCESKTHYDLNFLSKWRSACKNTNVYRTLKVFERNKGEAILLGPFLVDIDNSDKNLDDAQAVAKQVVTFLISQLELSLDDLRIFFSGRKGFNVEVRPKALDISGTVSEQIKISSGKLDNIITEVRKINKIQSSPYSAINMVSSQGTVVDRIYGDKFGYKLKHPYIRLHHSINKWLQNSDSQRSRMKIELTIEQLQTMSATEISYKAERLAKMLHL